ncbi:MAG: hypothetical protein NTU44_14655 [Bacteroidetes bacterium]|nr:hypothetical protein [Bacteroidota bacterium]
MQAAMFNVNSIIHGADGTVDVELVFDIGRGLVTDQRRFIDFEDAIYYIDSSKKNYILFGLENYIYPCKKISQSTNLAFYKRISRLESFDKIERFLWWAQKESLQKICSMVKRLEADLKVIELVKNHEYYFYLNSIRDSIIGFCNEEILSETLIHRPSML